MMVELVISHLPYGTDLIEDPQQALKVGIEGGDPGIHRGVPSLMDDATIHALNDQAAKLFIKSWLQLCHTDKMLQLCHFD